MINIFLIALMASMFFTSRTTYTQCIRSMKIHHANVYISSLVLSPLASAMFTPGIKQIAKDLNTTETMVTGATTSYVVFIGVGPLILAPLSETFGRRKLYLWCFAIFSVLQIPTALSKNVGVLIFLRAVAGFFGSKCPFP